MKKAFTIFSGFLHDFAARCWAASVLAVYSVDRMALRSTELKPGLNCPTITLQFKRYSFKMQQ
jgi:hypothetical protein